jgi:hypothetical protein
MFRFDFDHPQGDIFSLLQLINIKLSGLWLHAFYTCLLCIDALPSLVVAVQQQPDYGEHATTSTQSTTSITGMLPQTR